MSDWPQIIQRHAPALSGGGLRVLVALIDLTTRAHLAGDSRARATLADLETLTGCARATVATGVVEAIDTGIVQRAGRSHWQIAPPFLVQILNQNGSNIEPIDNGAHLAPVQIVNQNGSNIEPTSTTPQWVLVQNENQNGSNNEPNPTPTYARARARFSSTTAQYKNEKYREVAEALAAVGIGRDSRAMGQILTTNPKIDRVRGLIDHWRAKHPPTATGLLVRMILDGDQPPAPARIGGVPSEYAHIIKR